jgi:hypothetical protein
VLIGIVARRPPNACVIFANILCNPGTSKEQIVFHNGTFVEIGDGHVAFCIWPLWNVIRSLVLFWDQFGRVLPSPKW